MARVLTNLIENALRLCQTEAALHPRRHRRHVGRHHGYGHRRRHGCRGSATRVRALPTKTGGSGLGLANAKRIVEGSGGSIDLSTAPGQGTSVTITLPAALPGERASE